jgi:uncharacterized membrane-anchored protein YhcB (DUF1043 family)
MLYAVAEIAVFMVGATIVGFLLGRVTKRSAPKFNSGGDTAELARSQAAVRELESERASLRSQLVETKERVRQLANEPTASESSSAATEELAERKRGLEKALQDAEAQADRLRATIAARDAHIADLAAGIAPAESHDPSAPIGYSSSAGTLADTRIVFDDDEQP